MGHHHHHSGLCALGAAALLAAVAAASAAPDISVVGFDAVKQWARARIATAEESFAASGSARYASPAFWGSEIVYLVMPDRFNNGNASNDALNLPPQQAQYQGGSDLWGVQDWRQGGDLRGIIDRLDYIKDLGATTIWVTPVLKHNGDYHGYCTTDFTEIDPGFGTAEELRELTGQAHARGLKVVLDIVVNHVCDRGTSYARQPNDHVSCAHDLDGSYWSNAPPATTRQGSMSFGPNFFGPFKTEYFLNRCGANSFDEMMGTDSPTLFGDFTAGMYDFNTRNYDFQQIFTDLHKYWIAYADIDGFRLDAAKHVTMDFVAYFSTMVRAYANSVGKNNFLVIGEIASVADWMGRGLGKMFTNPYNPDDHDATRVPKSLTARIWDLKDTYLAHPNAKYPGVNAVYNFWLADSVHHILRNWKNCHYLEEEFFDDYQQTLAAQNDRRLNWYMLEIHDQPRYVKDLTDPFKSRVGVMLLPLVEAVPIIYYGLEQGFNGACHTDRIIAGAASGSVVDACHGTGDSLKRQSMFMSSGWRLGSTIPELNQLAFIGKSTAPAPAGPNDWQSDPFLNRNHMVYKASRAVNHIRQSCSALRAGNTAFRWGDYKTEGILAFSRLLGPQEIVVIANNAGYPITIPRLQVDPSINQAAGQHYKNMLNGLEVATIEREGTNSFMNFGGTQIDGNSVKVYAHEYNLSKWDSYLGAHLCTN
eukprot:m51a1_g7201 putative sulfonate abc transporter atp-binding protein (703) ;mRNA; f:199567-201736